MANPNPSPKTRFSKGQSGNPKGKPKGTRHSATMAMQRLLEGEREELTRKCIDLAKEGDSTAMRLCFERLYPAPKDAPVSFDLPPIKSLEDSTAVLGALLEAVSVGEVTPEEAKAIAAPIETWRRSVENEELARRIEALEAAEAERQQRNG